MRILFWQWHSFMNKGIENALVKMNQPYDTFFYQLEDWENNDDFKQKLDEKMRGQNYGLVLSVNYCPLIAQVCKDRKVQYLAWVYDSPMNIRNLEDTKNGYTNVYMFDRGMTERYQKQGYPVKYMPLAVDASAFAPEVSAGERQAYQTDVSLVGNLYQTEYAYFSGPLDEYQRGYLEGLINAQMKVYGGYLLPELLTDQFLEELNERYRKASGGTFEMGRRELEYMLACEVTGRERFIALSLLSGYCKVDLYSTKNSERLPKVNYKGYADYYSQMPQVFRNSKINLNISLKAICTGLPLRMVDVMGCGGLLMTNFQAELPEYFVMGEDCVVYEDLEQLVYLVRYYLEHENERARIAENGRRRVEADFTFEDRLTKMLKEY